MSESPDTSEPSAPSSPPRFRGPRWLRARPSVATKMNFGVLYAVDGALLPFFSVFLAHQHGLSTREIGFVLAVSSATAVVAPPVLTMLADRYNSAERLFTLMLVGSAASLLAFTFADGYWWVLVGYTAFCLCREPARPLLDGIFFASQRRIPAMAKVSYHRARLWGTFGYMVPGVALYFLMLNPDSLWYIPIIACALAALCVVVAFVLPTRHGDPPRVDRSGAGARRGTSWRDLVHGAFRLLSQPSTAAFVVAMFLLQASVAAYAAFYPLLLTDVVGVAPRWLGPIANLGVLVELGYLAAFGWFVRRLGWRWFMVLGALVAALRVGLLAGIPTIEVAVGTQVFHGMVIIASMVAGRVILDRQAPDEIRHTTQGLYVMLVIGTGRIVGSGLGGLAGEVNLSLVFTCAAIAALLAAGILVWALRDKSTVPATDVN